MVSQNQPVCLADHRRRRYLNVVADERRLDPPDTLDGCAAQHDGVLDLAVRDHAVPLHRGERADVRPGHARPGADHDRPDDAAPADLRAAADRDPADQLGLGVDLAAAAKGMAPELSEEMKARIETLVAERQAKRRVKDWAASDRMRDQLESLGVTLEDSKEGTKWELRR